MVNSTVPGQVHNFKKDRISSDLRGLLVVLGVVQKRILANSFLHAWIHWWNWILVGLIVVAALRAELAGSLLFAAALLATAAVGILLWKWRNGIDPYESACLLDRAAGLKDRLSTSLWFGETAHPQGFLLCQRRDALERLPNLDVRTLFPVRPPALARRTLLLALAVAGLFFYRVYHPAPLTSLLEATWHSQLLQSLLSPGRPSVTSAAQQVKNSPDEEAQVLDRRQSSDATDASDAWRDTNQDKSQQTANQPVQHATNTGDQPRDSSGFHPPDSLNGNQSLAQSFIQALKDMVSGPPEQDSSSSAEPEPSPQRQNSPQPKNDSQDGAGNNLDQSGSQSSRDSQPNGSQPIASAGGPPPIPKDPIKSSPLVVTPVVERVRLEAKKFKDQKRMPIEPETGSSDLEAGSVLRHGTATINGAEQEDIPERYRSYVQRYFEHVKKGQ
jgi:hypothetical protein